MTAKNNCVTIYTDGGCDPNPGVGGWGAVLMFNRKMKKLSGGDARTTNNRMEITAAIEAIRALKRPCKIVLHTDSQYLKNGITAWLPKWKQNDWKRKGGELKNVDLWKTLDSLCSNHDIQWKWVRGHAGNMYNELCDSLASGEIAKRKSKAPRR